MADSIGDSVPLLPEESKNKRLTDFQKCPICQEDSAEALRRAKATSLSTFIPAAEERNESMDLEFKDIFWHAGCYASYISKTNINRVKKRKLESSEGSQSIVGEISVPTAPSDMPNQTSVARSQTSITDRCKCLFCKRLSNKKERKLLNLASLDGRDTIYAAVEAKNDTELLFALSNVSKERLAAEGKYHRACRAAYVSKANLKHKQLMYSAMK